MDYKEFFLTDNLSGWKTREKLLQKNKPEIYNELKNFITINNLSDVPFKEQVWYFMNDEPDRKTCQGCSSPVTLKNTLSKGFNQFCSLACANNSGLLEERVTKSIKKKYGVDYFSQHESFIRKVKKTKLERYGSENFNNLEQAKITKELIYGDKNYSNKKKGGQTIRDNFIKGLSGKTTDQLVKYDLGDENIILKCSNCKMVYETYHNMFNFRIKNNIKPCTLCNPIGSTDSLQQKELTQFIKELLPEDVIEIEDRKQIPPYELDIYIPSKNLAIEFNGLYWHSDVYLEDNYHLQKSNFCKTKGINLIHIFEDEWIYKREIIKSVLRSKIGLYDTRIYARKCEIKEIDSITSRMFLDENHLQGSVNSDKRLGLFFNNELVSLITLGPLRKALGNNPQDRCYEILRFANKLNTSVIGGFSKLLSYFIKTYVPKSILTFSDKRYFTGSAYEKAGFKFIADTQPNYFYIVKHKREHRFKYRKDVLVRQGYDKNKTEKQIMMEREIPRIYDCGSKKWLLEL